MKVTVLGYNESTQNYICETGKGRRVEVDTRYLSVVCNSPESLVGRRMKLRDITYHDMVFSDTFGNREVYFPYLCEWYEIDKVSGKRIKSIPEEL